MTSPRAELLQELLLSLMQGSVEQILSDADSQRYLGWVDQFTRDYATRVSDDPALHEEAAALASNFARALWNAFPLPDNDFRPKPLRPVRRNDPCPCRSGRKHKRCCGLAPPPPLSVSALWPLILVRLNADQLRRVMAANRAPIDALIRAAVDEADDDRPMRAARLLEPLFDTPFRHTDESAEFALDLLIDMYSDLGWTGKKATLIERVITHAERSVLRSAALQRRAAMRMDSGDSAGAWQAFEQAQRDAPGRPALGLLEINLLLCEGKAERAVQRARFWQARLRAEAHPEDDGALRFFTDVIAGPEHLMQAIGIDTDVGTGRALANWLERVSARPLPSYRITIEPAGDAHDDEPGMGRLEPPQKLRSVEAAWRDVFPMSKPFATQPVADAAGVWSPAAVARWMDFLEQFPSAFDSIDILDDLANAVLAHASTGAFEPDESFLLPLLQRVQRIVQNALDAHGTVPLPWLELANRPALRSLVNLGFTLERRGQWPSALALLQLVLALNPKDNHGCRAPVINHYLREARYHAALKLAAAYPDDMQPDVPFGRALALYALGQRDEAEAAARRASESLPRVVHYLSAKRIKQPPMSDFGVAMGGDDQAWLYRQEMRDVWLAADGAMDWLKQVAPPVKRGPRART